MSFAVFLNARPRPSRRLSPRQVEVLFWKLHGMSGKEVAALLGIGKATVSEHWIKGTRRLGIRPPKMEFKLLKYRE